MVRRDDEVGKDADKQTVTSWYFRHDKIQDFLLSEFTTRHRLKVGR